MLLALLILPILSSANPFHKYPYVFLLDVGNEELEKVNTEQIRLSSPGGSLALRYPAIGNGDDIGHVRVSGIDFGTDLKANIVDGGPGYKYVVIVLLGNSGVEYDAVITIQTVPSVENDSIKTIEDNSIGNPDEDVSNANQVSEEDQNNSAEDIKDYAESSQISISDKNEELTQESSNVYSYSQNEALSGYGSEHDEESDSNSDGADDSDIEEKNYDQNEHVDVEDEDQNEDDSRISQPSAERYDAGDDDSSQPIIVDQNLYNKYIALKDHFYGSKVYPQDETQESSVYQNFDDRDDIEAYDYYEENNSGKFRDSNNNYIDTDGASAVEQ